MKTLFFLFALSWQVPQKPDSTANHQQPAAAYQRGSDSAPVSVKLLNTGKTKADSTQEAERIWSEERTQTRTLILSTLVVLMTLVQVVILGRQTQLLGESIGVMRQQEARMGDTIGQMESTAQRQLRAYVGVTVTRYTPQTATSPLAFSIGYKNYGQTPAYDVIVRCMNRVVLPFPMSEASELKNRDLPDPDPHPPHRLVLNPESPVSGSSSRFLPRLSEEDIAAVNQPIPESGNHPPQLYCFGTLEYRDIFLKQHWLHFCSMFGGDLTKVRVESGEVSHLYNDTSDNPA